MESTPDSYDSSALEATQFSERTHTLVGLYLFFIGLVGSVINCIVLTTFYRFRQLISPTALLLINLTIADIGVLALLFPFSSSSSFAKKWLYGETGCQIYAFMGFFAGSAHIGTLTLLALDRYVIAYQKTTKFRNKYNYWKCILGVWMYSLFWATMPLIGWGRYGIDNSISACTIDWRHNDSAYKSFIIFYTLFGFIIPLIVINYCYYKILIKVRKGLDRTENSKLNGEAIWLKERTVTLMSVLIIVVFVLSWTPYAILCLWTVFSDVGSVPLWFTLLPPLFAKTSTLFNPIIYYLTNNRLRGAFLSSVFCRDLSQPIIGSLGGSLSVNESPIKVVRFTKEQDETCLT